jgi:cell pole-organizing protein PopZ
MVANRGKAGLLFRERGEKGESPMTETSAGRKADTQEPSMEDILASIRRILAEDGAHSQEMEPAGPDADVAAALSPEAETEPEHAPEELVMNEAADPSVADRDTEPSIGRPGVAAEEDVFLLSPEMRASGPTLVSQQAAENSMDVLSQLARAILDRRDIAVAARDVTLESMVREMLRPLLREWLDRNLPYLIERLVKKEIDLMINRAERLED